MHDLRALLAGMAPALLPGEYVFCTLPPGTEPLAGIVPFATVREAEGLTLVVERGLAPPDAPCSAPMRAITLTVHSSLDAVGFIAAIARALADAGIPANVIAGYYHDHVLVPTERAADAMRALRAISAG